MKKPLPFILLISVILLASSHASSQPVPILQCVSVMGDSIRITWTIDNTDFESYRLEQSLDLGFLTPTLFIPDHDSSAFNLLAPSPFTSTVYYRLQTFDSQGYPSPYSNILKIIFLSVIPLDLSNSVAVLSWNPVSDDATGQYTIYRQASGESVWQSIGATQGTEYQDAITYPYCDLTLIRYKIEYADPGATCSSWSSADSVTLQDGISPPAVQMDSVSVSLNGDVMVSWQPVDMAGLLAYIVYHDTIPGDYGPYHACDTISRDTLFFVDTAIYAMRKSIGYRITAVDSCGNESILDVENPLNTLYLDKIHWDYCDISIDLSWNAAASSLVPPATKYSVYQIDTTTFASQLLMETQETQIVYETGFKPDSTYCYFIRAQNSSGKSSTSCIQCFYVDRPEQPDTLNLQLVTVDTLTNDQITVSAYVDTLPDSTTFVLLRRIGLDDPFKPIQKIKVENASILALTDTTAQVNQHPYYYKAIIQDGCGHEAWFDKNRDGLMDTIEVRTIFLQGMANDQLNHLYWNRYLSTLAEVVGYRLIRKVDGVVDTIIDTGLDTLYDDYVYDLAAGSGRFSYLAEARIVDKNAVGPDTLSSFSNEIAQTRAARLYMPTGFTPNSDGMNDYFLPRNSFSDDQADFIFLVYNRWGQKIYESTTSSDPGWDGTVNGIPAPDGVYVYFIRYVSSEGEIYEKKGTVTLLR